MNPYRHNTQFNKLVEGKRQLFLTAEIQLTDVERMMELGAGGRGDYHLAKTTVIIVAGQNAHWKLKLAAASIKRDSTFA